MNQFDNFEQIDYIRTIKTWADLSNELVRLAPNQTKQFTQEIREKLRNGHYKKPAPIQKMVLPYLLQEKTEERFVYIKSPTGTGKTLAFILPIIFFFEVDYIQQFYKQVQDGPVQYYPFAIVIVATHALLAQIQKDFDGAVPNSLKSKGFKVQHFDKGQDESEIHGHILCGVPNTILRLIKQNLINLENIRFIIVDEADSTIQNDRNQLVIQILQKFIDSNNLRWKIVCCGATMEVEALKSLFTQLKEPKKIQQSQQQVINELIQPLVIKPDFYKFKFFDFKITLDNIYHYYYDEAYSEEQLLAKMVEVIRDTLKKFTEAQIMIFFNAKVKCTETKQLLLQDKQLDFLVTKNKICEIIQDKAENYTSPEQMRKAQQEIIDEFKKGTYQIMFCSDLMGRGMNFRKVRLVINFGAPRVTPFGEFDFRRYNQRVGRTGRMEDLGVALTLCNKTIKPDSADFTEDKFVSKIKEQNITIEKYDFKQFIEKLKEVYEKTTQKQQGV